jgi:LacI family transcriptional regulator
MTKKISIKDIAKELNISITTVSFVINGKSEEMGISQATANRVNELISQWGFNPNSAARMLRTGKSKTIGLIIEDIGNYFFGNIAKIIEVEASKKGYNVFFSSTDNSDVRAKDLIKKMKNSSVDGMIITPTKGLVEDIKLLEKQNVPFVLLDRLIPDIEANHVILNNYKGAYDLTKHLIKNGYKQIGFISIFSDLSQMDEREKGFMDALDKAGKTIPDEAILKVRFDQSGTEIVLAIEKYLKKNPQLDALFFATNYLGVYGLEALQNANKKIPKDIAVVSFDDNDLFRLYTPSITVAAQPIHDIAVEAINLLLNIIHDRDKKNNPEGIVLDPQLIERNSSPKKKTMLLVE